MADERMRELFLSGKTTDRTYRGETLGKLYADVRAKKNDIVGCLAGDLGRPAKECALIYSSMIEKPARIAAKKDWTKWRWLAPVLPDFITTGRVYRDSSRHLWRGIRQCCLFPEGRRRQEPYLRILQMQLYPQTSA